ncbi:hypothetical protein RT723_10345 [Psychrosphaera aquimarina]|uniref:Uncharacterized protein n=1 Tax=Psychrosphaera aquimarina TaxID=2044854 RepID=A0ABU3R133_9GAMM|nr:hypothetical protein [Psychrosphaera aquimarina]MDU0113387.1 hypothetical protein [Psychrosphaera aquimarina]
MLSDQLLNVMRMFAEPSIYKDFSTSSEISNVINQLSLNRLTSNREKYVISCLNIAVLDALKSSLSKVNDQEVTHELALLFNELEQFQLILLSTEAGRH